VLAGLTLRGDIVHAQWWSFPLAPVYAVILGIARLRGKRVVMTVHNSEPHEGGLLRRLANRAVLPFAQRIVVHTEQNAVTLRGRVRPSRVAIVPIGVGTPRQVTVEDREAARRALNLDTATPVVLFHGNIRPYKGLSDLLAAFRFVAEVIPNARLIIAGQPWSSADDVHAGVAAHRLDEQVITRLAYLPSEELDQLFVAADLVVYPYTHFDAQSAAACDAIRYGKAIVVSDVGGLPDLVRNPVAVVPPRRPDALANAIIGVLRDGVLRRSLERDAEALAAELAWPRIAEQTVHVYRAVSARGRHAPSHEPARSSIGEIELRNTAKEATWR
jgi:glycosyltransferase involved in cell wall biosynthesis